MMSAKCFVVRSAHLTLPSFASSRPSASFRLWAVLYFSDTGVFLSSSLNVGESLSTRSASVLAHFPVATSMFASVAS
ncbi:hypothetical protein WI27_27375 [Burkholderia cepacia]|nr:hypothetical protein WI27_27375 [Burkholderia cepacia]